MSARSRDHSYAQAHRGTLQQSPHSAFVHDVFLVSLSCVSLHVGFVPFSPLVHTHLGVVTLPCFMLQQLVIAFFSICRILHCIPSSSFHSVLEFCRYFQVDFAALASLVMIRAVLAYSHCSTLKLHAVCTHHFPEISFKPIDARTFSGQIEIHRYIEHGMHTIALMLLVALTLLTLVVALSVC